MKMYLSSSPMVPQLVPSNFPGDMANDGNPSKGQGVQFACTCDFPVIVIEGPVAQASLGASGIRTFII